jgi:FkbH-like protein
MDIYSELNNPNTVIKEFNADYYILSITQLIKGIFGLYENAREKFKNNDFLLKEVDQIMNNLNISIKKIREFSNNPIFILTTIYLSNDDALGLNEYLNVSISYDELCKYIDIQFYKITKNHNLIYLLDLNKIFENYDKKKCIRPYQTMRYGHLKNLGSFLLLENFYSKISIIDKSLQRIKCVIVDCDNTLWKGIIIDDGIDNIKLKEEICDILVRLSKRGLIIGLCSKNNPNDINIIKDKILSPNEYGKLLLDSIVITKINWNPKSINLKEIANELNIGLDTIAFFDDSKFEREEVKTNTPDVKVYKETDLYYCLNNPIFNNINGLITIDNEKRKNTYISNLNRNNDLKFNNNDFDTFMINSNFVIEICDMKEENIQRCYELIHKTNQMNTTNKRTDYDKFNEYFKSNSHKIYEIHLKDKYDDYGIIGTYIIEQIDDVTYTIIEFNFSCRAMGKLIEDYVIMHIIIEKKLNDKIIINITETSKNKTFIKVFEKYDFVKKNDYYIHIKSNKVYDKILWL